MGRGGWSGERPGREFDHWTPSSIEVKNEWITTSSALPICLIGVDRHNFTFFIFLTNFRSVEPKTTETWVAMHVSVFVAKTIALRHCRQFFSL